MKPKPFLEDEKKNVTSTFVVTLFLPKAVQQMLKSINVTYIVSPGFPSLDNKQKSCHIFHNSVFQIVIFFSSLRGCNCIYDYCPGNCRRTFFLFLYEKRDSISNTFFLLFFFLVYRFYDF